MIGKIYKNVWHHLLWLNFHLKVVKWIVWKDVCENICCVKDTLKLYSNKFDKHDTAVFESIGAMCMQRIHYKMWTIN